jgi:hypothetical protein
MKGPIQQRSESHVLWFQKADVCDCQQRVAKRHLAPDSLRPAKCRRMVSAIALPKAAIRDLDCWRICRTSLRNPLPRSASEP